MNQDKHLKITEILHLMLFLLKINLKQQKLQMLLPEMLPMLKRHSMKKQELQLEE